MGPLSVLVGLLSGCSAVPTSGPSAGAVINQGTQTAQAPGATVQDYEFIDLNPSVMEILNRRSMDSFASRFGDYRPSAEPVIGIGDAVSVTIWEASAGGLFSAPVLSDKFSSGANSATIPTQLVGRDGAITVPTPDASKSPATRLALCNW